MIKKLLLATLTVFSFVGLTACGNEGKKLNAEEAKQEIKLAQQNTAKAIKEGKGIKIDVNGKVESTVSAKNIKVDSNLGSLIPEIKTAKLQASFSTKESLAFDIANFKGKATASENASVKFNYTAGDKTEKFEVTSKGEGEAYLIKNENKLNLYAKGELKNTFNLPDSYKDSIDQDKLKDLSGKINIGYEIDPEDNNDINDLIGLITSGSYEEMITEYDLSTLIQDWTIFTKKGNTLSADCSNLKAFGVDEKTLTDLAAMGLTLKISKFELGLNKDNYITSFDFDASLKGSVDLSKQEIDKDDIVDLITKFKPEYATMLNMITINGMSGTITVDASCALGYDVTYNPGTISVPEDLAKTEETDLMTIFAAIFGGIDSSEAAVTPANSTVE